MSRSKTASLATLTVWLALAACANSPEARALPASEVVIPARPALPMTSDERHERWLKNRQKAMSVAEVQTKVLMKARQELKGRRLGIPRDAAICFQARHLQDLALREAMQAGGELKPALERWHAQGRGVDTFCAYALTAGEPE